MQRQRQKQKEKQKWKYICIAEFNLDQQAYEEKQGCNCQLYILVAGRSEYMRETGILYKFYYCNL